jgi:GNAT superfamily N-acetyltransferase
VTSAPTIRLVEPRDLPSLLDLLDQLREGSTSGVPWDRADAGRAETVLQRIIDDRRRTFLVAELDGEVVGTADLLIIANLTHGARPVAFVENVVVDANHRGAGIGRALMDDVIERARAEGCYKVQFLSNKDRTRAHAFYRRMGFSPSAEGFRLYLEV